MYYWLRPVGGDKMKDLITQVGIEKIVMIVGACVYAINTLAFATRAAIEAVSAALEKKVEGNKFYAVIVKVIDFTAKVMDILHFNPKH